MTTQIDHRSLERLTILRQQAEDTAREATRAVARANLAQHQHQAALLEVLLEYDLDPATTVIQPDGTIRSAQDAAERPARALAP